MKKLLFLLMASLLIGNPMGAQEADVREAMKSYKNVRSLQASVVRTQHRAAVVDDAVTEGQLYFKAPGRMCMTFGETGDWMLMDGGVFTMAVGGRKSVAKGPTLAQFQSLVSVFEDVVLGISSAETVDADVAVVREGNLCRLTVTPVLGGGKGKRRLMFTSFVLVIDLRAGEFKSLQMNERGQNYTRYDFSGFRMGDEVPDAVFQLPGASL